LNNRDFVDEMAAVRQGFNLFVFPLMQSEERQDCHNDDNQSD